ncbi:MAG TPA: hypothetical protein VFD07_13040 [Candidatus Krumholzibacteria bacterium]|nr:hypothetical protein [Candidatus Krumholzibacteria bacterium]
MSVSLTNVTSDEPNSGHGGCVDAVLSPTELPELRARRSATGGGRVYRFSFVDLLYGCPGEVSVCVPSTPDKPCIDDGQLFDPRVCVGSATTGGDLAPAVTVRPVIGSGIEIVVSEAMGKRIGIEVFDARGRRIARLEPRVADGAGVILWNGRSADGQPVAAGVYLVRTTVDGTAHTAKTVLVR